MSVKIKLAVKRIIGVFEKNMVQLINHSLRCGLKGGKLASSVMLPEIKGYRLNAVFMSDRGFFIVA